VELPEHDTNVSKHVNTVKILCTHIYIYIYRERERERERERVCVCALLGEIKNYIQTA
jgi:hypothetical protein